VSCIGGYKSLSCIIVEKLEDDWMRTDASVHSSIVHNNACENYPYRFS
jgi:hypothetical protein